MEDHNHSSHPPDEPRRTVLYKLSPDVFNAIVSYLRPTWGEEKERILALRLLKTLRTRQLPPPNFTLPRQAYFSLGSLFFELHGELTISSGLTIESYLRATIETLIDSDEWSKSKDPNITMSLDNWSLFNAINTPNEKFLTLILPYIDLNSSSIIGKDINWVLRTILYNFSEHESSQEPLVNILELLVSEGLVCYSFMEYHLEQQEQAGFYYEYYDHIKKGAQKVLKFLGDTERPLLREFFLEILNRRD